MQRLVLVVALVACRAPKVEHPKSPEGPPAPTSFDPAAIDAWVAAEIEERGAIGAALVVVRDGKTELAKGYGTREVGTDQPIDADTPFAIGSVSKQFACAAALALADDGKLSMDDRVAKYYPLLTAANDITLADLGGHVAGYRDYYPLDYVDTRIARPVTPDELLVRYAGPGTELDFPPRTRWSYSNTGFVLLARVVEKVSGVPYAKFLEDRFWKPLGMTATLARPANAASGHVAFLLEAPRPATPEGAGWLFGAGDIYASANDLARWDVALGEGKLLSEAARAAMATPLRTTDTRTTNYGCGLASRIVHGETVLAHSGWVGGFVAYNAIVPRTRTAVVLLTNDQHVDLGDLHDKVLRLALENTAAIPVVPGPPAAEVARSLVLQLQRDALDRSQLGDDLNAYFDPARLAIASPKLRALGEPKVTLLSRGERGGLEVTKLKIAFPDKTVQASMFRAPSGKIHQFLMTP